MYLTFLENYANGNEMSKEILFYYLLFFLDTETLIRQSFVFVVCFPSSIPQCKSEDCLPFLSAEEKTNIK